MELDTVTSAPPPPFMGNTVAQSAAVPEVKPVATREPDPVVRETPAQTSEPTPQDARVTTLRNAALWYVTALGLTVTYAHYPVRTSLVEAEQSCSCGSGIACDNVGKHPVETGFYATKNFHIRSREDADRVWADKPYNVYPLVGEETQTLVLDIDPRGGGTESFERLCNDVREIVNLRDTFHYATSDGGFHYYYRIADSSVWSGLKKLRSSFARYPGVDLKDRTGGVIAAPSLHKSGVNYARVDESPLYLQVWDPATWSRMASVLRESTPGRPLRTVTAVGRGTWADNLDMEDKYRSTLGVGLGGTVGYEDLCQQLLDGVDGAASRIVEYYAYHGCLPEQRVKLTHGETGRNNFLVDVLGRAADYCFKDEVVNGAMYEMWRAEGGDEHADPSTNAIFPSLYFDMCTEISAKLTDPPYHLDRPGKYRSMMTRFMLKEWDMS
ncbi:DNA primase/polymerase [Gordonia phage Phendrix]|uniref:DNA primase/polymerase n=1 Tax=Gordonia phage Phendrix TaxID=2593335 RepID=A0A514U1C0_9CAUD|nr:DNA primase/polymerase [Gordonia phage Phendrix]QDK02705.1 DNA primase/polymerase [Gordonia phage Phendrix]